MNSSSIENQMSIVKKITVVYGVFLSVLLALGLASLLSLLFVSQKGRTTGEITLRSSQRHQGLVDIVYLMNEMLANDPVTWENGTVSGRND